MGVPSEEAGDANEEAADPGRGPPAGPPGGRPLGFLTVPPSVRPGLLGVPEAAEGFLTAGLLRPVISISEEGIPFILAR